VELGPRHPQLPDTLGVVAIELMNGQLVREPIQIYRRGRRTPFFTPQYIAVEPLDSMIFWGRYIFFELFDDCS
jgi:hypothetical protein